MSGNNVLKNHSALCQAFEIMRILFHKRRLLPMSKEVEDFESEARPHVSKLLHFMDKKEPIHLILPAFPAKSPNRKKTLSAYPDKGEEVALAHLNEICQRIQTVYSPGAKLTLCSDGRVFADIVRIPDEDVTTYKKDLIDRVSFPYRDVIDFFDLDDAYPSITDYDCLREELMINHGESLHKLRLKCKTDISAGEMYKGICRFLVEDFSGLDEFGGHSKSGVLNIARPAAYRVIQRSNAWSQLLKRYFPTSIRLSIHPQPRVSEKIGAFLVETKDAWRTPWHSVALKRGETISLVPRSRAESEDAHLIFENGRASYFAVPTLASKGD
ncbi:isocyanide synthase family protein [Pseudomonas chlororaphis]|uniref:isocyanide synthase family protein n=1 Tax=Pseudomonas chlororaphis TaxID=587753 RepID=UPI0004B55E09|nr:isocyanide synthase family protein [Pseudomonas chlororaphis]